MTSRLEAQNDMIIALLARLTLTVEGITRTVTVGKKKGKPEDFIAAYNALDGTKTIGEVAAMVGITQQGMGSVLQTWEEEGIVYKVGSGSNARYYGLLRLPRKGRKGDTNKKDPGRQRRVRSLLTPMGVIEQETDDVSQDEGDGGFVDRDTADTPEEEPEE
jgi:hypothetical protein